MVEDGSPLLPLEPGEAIRVVREGVRQNLQRDLAVELGVGGLPDLAHPAFAEQSGHIVVPDAGAGTQGYDLQGPAGSFYAEAVHGASRQVRKCDPVGAALAQKTNE